MLKSIHSLLWKSHYPFTFNKNRPKKKTPITFVWKLLKAIRWSQDLIRLFCLFTNSIRLAFYDWLVCCINPLAYKTSSLVAGTPLEEDREAAVFWELIHPGKSKASHSQYSNQHVFHYESPTFPHLENTTITPLCIATKTPFIYLCSLLFGLYLWVVCIPLVGIQPLS